MSDTVDDPKIKKSEPNSIIVFETMNVIRLPNRSLNIPLGISVVTITTLYTPMNRARVLKVAPLSSIKRFITGRVIPNPKEDKIAMIPNRIIFVPPQ
jgi:hypothetical protein